MWVDSSERAGRITQSAKETRPKRRKKREERGFGVGVRVGVGVGASFKVLKRLDQFYFLLVASTEHVEIPFVRVD